MWQHGWIKRVLKNVTGSHLYEEYKNQNKQNKRKTNTQRKNNWFLKGSGERVGETAEEIKRYQLLVTK